MADAQQTETATASELLCASEIAHAAEVRRSRNGVRYATFGETGVADVELDRMLEAVPAAITEALQSSTTYYFVPLAMRNPMGEMAGEEDGRTGSTQISRGYTQELAEGAICHRSVELSQGRHGVFISTRLMGDRFALSFEFYINVAHAFVDRVGVPMMFEDLVWKQALDNVRGETSSDAWESRNMTFGRAPNSMPEVTHPITRRRRGSAYSFASSARGAAEGIACGEGKRPGGPERRGSSRMIQMDEQERRRYLAAAFSDSVAIYLLSLALDFDYTELREREYPLLAPAALAARLRAVAEMYPSPLGYEFAVQYRRR